MERIARKVFDQKFVFTGKGNGKTSENFKIAVVDGLGLAVNQNGFPKLQSGSAKTVGKYVSQFRRLPGPGASRK
jgi:hypothetical protein